MQAPNLFDWSVSQLCDHGSLCERRGRTHRACRLHDGAASGADTLLRILEDKFIQEAHELEIS